MYLGKELPWAHAGFQDIPSRDETSIINCSSSLDFSFKCQQPRCNSERQMVGESGFEFVWFGFGFFGTCGMLRSCSQLSDWGHGGLNAPVDHVLGGSEGTGVESRPSTFKV